MNGTMDTIRVLHVDDKASFSEMVTSFLEREDDRIRVQTATSADEGLEILTDRRIDCVVSDYEMPRMNGIEFLNVVREEYPDLPFILYTGKGSEAVASDAISAGATDYLQKGTESSQYTVLANRIANAVDQHHVQLRSKRHKRELEEQRQLYRTLVEQSPSGILIVQDFEITFSNSKTGELTGLSESELVGRPFYEIMTPEYRELVRKRYERRIDGEQPPQNYEVEIVGSDGDPRIVDLHVSRIQHRGEPATLATLSDITEYKTRDGD